MTTKTTNLTQDARSCFVRYTHNGGAAFDAFLAALHQAREELSQGVVVASVRSPFFGMDSPLSGDDSVDFLESIVRQHASTVAHEVLDSLECVESLQVTVQPAHLVVIFVVR